ncbi:MAG: hypothetical protein IMF01_09355 [Proteobacteria bacterium]|nr:hypothetical protein [Pseudomonadota bacterium]
MSKKELNFRHVGATAILTTMLLGSVGFIASTVITNATAIATVVERNKGVSNSIKVMRQDIGRKLDKIEDKQDWIIKNIGNRAK